MTHEQQIRGKIPATLIAESKLFSANNTLVWGHVFLSRNAKYSALCCRWESKSKPDRARPSSLCFYWSREDREASTNSGMTAIEPAEWFFAMGT